MRRTAGQRRRRATSSRDVVVGLGDGHFDLVDFLERALLLTSSAFIAVALATFPHPLSVPSIALLSVAAATTALLRRRGSYATRRRWLTFGMLALSSMGGVAFGPTLGWGTVLAAWVALVSVAVDRRWWPIVPASGVVVMVFVGLGFVHGWWPALDSDTISASAWLRVAAVNGTLVSIVGLSAWRFIGTIRQVNLDMERASAAHEGELAAARHASRAMRNTRATSGQGHLAGGITHDVNNALAVIQINAKLLVDTPSSASDSHSAHLINAAVDDATQAARALMAMSRAHFEDERRCRVDEAFVNIERFLVHALPETVDVRVATAPPIEVATTSAILQRALVGVVLYGLHALDDDGSLTIYTETATGSDGAPVARIEMVRTLPEQRTSLSGPLKDDDGARLHAAIASLRQAGATAIDLSQPHPHQRRAVILLPSLEALDRPVGRLVPDEIPSLRHVAHIVVAGRRGPMVDTVTRTLRARGYSVEAVNDAHSISLALTAPRPPDVVVTELAMMDSPSQLATLRRECASAMFIGWTNDPTVGLDAYLDDTLYLPFEVADLVRMMERLVEVGRRRGRSHGSKVA